MLNKEEMMKKLNKDAEALKKQIEHKKLCNLKNTLIRYLIKSGIVLDSFAPIIISATINCIIIINLDNDQNNKEIKASCKIIDTSTGIHMKNSSFDIKYDENSIEYSTGWKLNENGLYERIVTTYKIDDSIDLNNKEEIFDKSKQQLDEILQISNVETIQKNALFNDMYSEDMIIITQSKEDEKLKKIVSKDLPDKFFQYVFGISTTIIFSIVHQIFIGTKIKKKLKQIIPKDTSKIELETLKKVLKLKQENLDLLNDEQDEQIVKKYFINKDR